MLGFAVTQSSNELANDDVKNAATRVVQTISKQLKSACDELRLHKQAINGLSPGDVVYVIDRKKVHVAFVRTNAGVSHFLICSLPDNDLSDQDVVNIGYQELGHSSFSCISFPKNWLSEPEENFEKAIKSLVLPMAQEAKKMAGRPEMPQGYEVYKPLVHKFLDDNPDYDKNIFVAMRFSESEQNDAIWNTIKTTLANLGFKAHRADQKVYPEDDDLWGNVVTYMLGSRFGICVFDQIDSRDFNPNVQIEYGFMRALNKRVLLLKDSRQPVMPTDITGKIYRPFDSYKIKETLGPAVESWAKTHLVVN